MAIKNQDKNISYFKKHHGQSAKISLIIYQLVVFLIISTSLILTDVAEWNNLSFWILLTLSFILSTIIILALLNRTSRPLYDILAALSHKTGELTTETPPNPNSKKNEKTGLKHILQVIYETEVVEANKKSKKDNSSLLTKALNQTSCGVVVFGPDKKIISANKSAPVSYEQDGTPFLALSFDDDVDIMSWIAKSDDIAINAEHRWQRVVTDSRFIKKQRFFDIVASYEKGSPAETVVFLIDQSERHQPEEEDLNFVAFAAHELRGPITIIRGYLDILEQELADRLKGDEPELLKRLVVSSNRLSSYVSNILNVAKYDRHHLQVHLFEDSVSDIYASIADDMMLRAKSQHRMLSVDIPQDLPTVAADRGSIGEVIGNLIDNGIKYSFEGGLVSVSAVAKGEFVEISVTDNGIGMPASVVKNLFRKFYRSHRSREAVAGTGIGLYVSKAFVESHGGSITARSQEGSGSTFSFTLPTYASVADKLLEDGQLNQSLIRKSGGWIKNHAMYRK